MSKTPNNAVNRDAQTAGFAARYLRRSAIDRSQANSGRIFRAEQKAALADELA
ncbi:MAG: hypothetical protein M0T84_09630 [Betaproteobacteria bacterium]|nr:hypothetical protein [Betaproteobacteria bacterium]